MPQPVISVEPRSPAARAGLCPGDALLSINGHEIRDVLDYRYYSSDARLALVYTRGGRRRRALIRKEEGEPLGLLFAEGLMDKPRACANRCVFCFIDQLPPGLRESLYFKDDDARLSFLQGSYITLTNLSERELERIRALRISPIRVSVHATEPDLRRRLLGNPRAGACLDIMRSFAQAGVCMECQVVVCPGLNDGDALRRTMEELAALYPAVESVSVVPVGLTKHRAGLPALVPVDGEKAAEIIAAVDGFGRLCLETKGARVFACADELYLRAGLPLPDWEYYEGFPQFENGVGMLRALEDEFAEALAGLDAAPPRPAPFSVATGLAARPLLTKLVQKAGRLWYPMDNEAVCGHVYGLENRFFGETVDVAGLLTGRDLVEQLRGRALGARVLISVSMLRHGGDRFLDDMTLKEASAALGVPIVPVPNDGAALLDAIVQER